jgi:hypothetical protein
VAGIFLFALFCAGSNLTWAILGHYLKLGWRGSRARGMWELFLLVIFTRGRLQEVSVRLFGLCVGVFCGVVVQFVWVGDRRLGTSR